MAPRHYEKLLPNEVVADNPYPQLWDLLSKIIAGSGSVQPVEEVGPLILDLLSQDKPPLRFQTAQSATDFIAPKLAADLDGTGVSGASRCACASPT